MIRTQIQLTDEQARAIRRLAQAQGVSMAEMIRRFIDDGLAKSDDRAARWAAALRMIESIDYEDIDGATDVSTNHDKYFVDGIL
jgi:hypothetical protein